MKFDLKRNDRRAFLVLVLVLAIYVFFAEVALPVYDGLAIAADSALEKEDQLRRYRRAVIRRADYGQLLEEARRRMEAGEGRLIRGDNASLASAELQTIVEGVAEVTGVVLGPRNMSTARKKDEFFNEITMTLGFDCTPGQLVGFLTQLRASDKLIAVRSLRVSPHEAVDGVALGVGLSKDVTVNLTVAAVLASATVAPPDEG